MWKITKINNEKINKKKNDVLYLDYVNAKKTNKTLSALALTNKGTAAESAKENIDSFLKSKRKVLKETQVTSSDQFELSVSNKFTRKNYVEKFTLNSKMTNLEKVEAIQKYKNTIRAKIKKDKGIYNVGPTNIKVSDDETVQLNIENHTWTSSFDSSITYSYPYVQAGDFRIGHINPGDFLNIFKLKRINKIFEHKKPKTSENHLGVEFEFISKSDRKAIAQELAKEELFDYVTLTSDGSLRREDDYKHCHELCVLVPVSQMEELLTKVTDVINRMQSKVNKTCGTHVHIDMRNRDHKVVFNNLVTVQDILYSMQDLRRNQPDGTNYCKKVTSNDFNSVLQGADGSRGDRYWGINPQAFAKHKTLEVRIHSGTINKDKIINWCALLNAVADRTYKYETTCDDLGKFKKRFGVSDGVLEYMSMRIKKFNPTGDRHLVLDEAS